MRLITTGLALLVMAATFPTAAPAAPSVEPPPPGDAANVVAGEPRQGRLEPIGVLAGHTYAVPTLTAGLGSDDADVRARCCFLLGQIASRDSKGALLDALSDPDRTVRMFAGIALARMGDYAGCHAARASYDGTRWWIRYWAIDALARLNQVPDVALSDPDPLVRALAGDARMGAWGPVSAQTEYAGPTDAPLGELMDAFTNYLIGETDWWWHAGQYEQVLRGQETIVWLDPTWLDGLTNAGYLYWSLERDGEALATYRRAVAMHPDRWESHFELGFFYFNAQKRYADAVPEFARARELGCPPVQARMHAHALEDAGRNAEALEVWRELLANSPDDGVVRGNLQRLEAEMRSG